MVIISVHYQKDPETDMKIMASLPRRLKVFAISIVLAGCASAGLIGIDQEAMFGKTRIIDHRYTADSADAQQYLHDVKPILENRCVVCHGCYDAPCQLKLSSADGIMRGASKAPVYDGTRILASEPTRLGIDATSVEEWRSKDFYPVLNERTQATDINMANSVLYRMLALKANNPLPQGTLLDDDDFSLGLHREQQCPAPSDMTSFEQDHPLWGMPYALPALADHEYQVLTDWIKRGAPMAASPALPEHIQQQVDGWETFLNQPDNKHQLTSRYVYEHLFLASLYFSDEPLFHKSSYGTENTQRPDFWFKLVRSYTPPGSPVKPVATRRPYDDPKLAKGGRVYYRLMLNDASVVAKTHMPYQLSEERMNWIQSMFIEPEYSVENLPGYDTEISANPFVVFEQLPVNARYRFMLQEAEYTITGFIKGPVCRGQVALNVIDDHFWVYFVDPERQNNDNYAHFLKSQSDNLKLPGESESTTGILTNWIKYSWLHDQYLDAKNAWMAKSFPDGRELTTQLVWDGDGHNPNAALTIFRHFDSSTVVKGMVGQAPKTAWIVDYSLLERIHYLLVAEFDVFGNIGHQLMTRLYMDFLRMEGEYNFLTLLPHEERVKLADYWYRDTSERVREHLVNYEEHVRSNPAIEYETDQPKQELFNKLRQRLNAELDDKYTLAHHVLPGELSVLERINKIQGEAATLMPEISVLMLDNMHGGSQLFTLIRNSGHSNLTGLLYEEDNRLPEEDYLTLVPGLLGSYPSAFYRLSAFCAESFAEAIEQLEDEDDYEAMANRFAVRRTNPDFWQNSDDVMNWYHRNDPLNAGILDYNRLENR